MKGYVRFFPADFFFEKRKHIRWVNLSNIRRGNISLGWTNPFYPIFVRWKWKIAPKQIFGNLRTKKTEISRGDHVGCYEKDGHPTAICVFPLKSFWSSNWAREKNNNLYPIPWYCFVKNRIPFHNGWFHAWPRVIFSIKQNFLHQTFCSSIRITFIHPFYSPGLLFLLFFLPTGLFLCPILPL